MKSAAQNGGNPFPCDAARRKHMVSRQRVTCPISAFYLHWTNVGSINSSALLPMPWDYRGEGFVPVGKPQGPMDEPTVDDTVGGALWVST